jgi:hypothetical protein
LLESNLEERRQDDGPVCANNSVARIPSGLDPDLCDDVDDDRYSNGNKTREPRRENPTAIRVRPLRVDDISGSRIESNGERSCDDDRRVVDLGHVSDAT